jgi:hypothetical protein
MSTWRPLTPRLRLFSIGFVVLTLGVLFGLLAASADPMIIGFGVGFICLPLFFAVPELSIWFILSGGLLMGELTANPQLSKLTWIISLLSMMLIVPSCINLFWSKQRRAPAFLIMALVFMVYTLVSSLIQLHSIEEVTAGFKRYFQSFGLMLALTMLAFAPHTYEMWRKFILAIALLQFPFALYQLLVLVPQRGGVSAGSEATDVIAGTFGANLQGGSPNSVMVIFIFIVLSFLIARWRVSLIRNLPFYLFSLICLVPLGMGETKVAVIMMPMVGLILLKDDLRRAPLRHLPAFIGLALLTAVLGYLYVVVMMNSTLSAAVDSTLRYNLGSQGYSASQLLNRFTSITFWIEQQHLSNPLSFFVGNGLGGSYTSTGALSGHVALRYPGYGINLTAASTLLWDTGILGLALFTSIFVAAWKAASRLRLQALDTAVKADALAIQACVSLFGVSLFYSDSIVNLMSMEILYATVLGYLGYLINQNDLFDEVALRRNNPRCD